MQDIERKKFITFLVIALIFVGVSGYYHFQSNPTSFSTTSVTTRLKEMRAKAEKITQPNTLPQLPNEAGRITNDNCGLSFVIPQEWEIDEVTQGNRFCKYEVHAPNNRVATLEIGVPGWVPRKNSFENFTWDDIINEINSSSSNSRNENITIAGVPGIRILVPERDGWQPNAMYFFRKGESVFYVRYSIWIDGYEKFNQYNNRQINIEDYYHDVDPVLESIRFSKENSFYDIPMTVGPK